MELKHSGYKINTTLEEEFWSGTKGNDVIKVSISGTDITIDYFPKIYVCEEYSRKGSYFADGTDYEYDIYWRADATDAVYKNYEKRAVEGFKQWAKDSINIQGVNAKVIVNVTPTRARSRGDANVTITAYKTGTSMVPTTLYWSTSTKPSMILSDARESGDASYVDRATGKPGDMFSNMAAHEFGHVLSLWDAYGYGNHWRPLEYPLPGVPANRAGTLNVMRSPWWSEFGYEAINYEMVLYAWSTNSLGGWTETVLTNTSQAFYR